MKTKLTYRQEQVLPLLLEGLTNAQIAEKIGISATTVKTHVGNLLKKHHVHNRRQLLAKTLANFHAQNVKGASEPASGNQPGAHPTGVVPPKAPGDCS